MPNFWPFSLNQMLAINQPRINKPITPSPSRRPDRWRIGPRISACGRHTMANADPSSSPPARLNVLRYSDSLMLMHRPNSVQYPCRWSAVQVAATSPLWKISATSRATATLAPANHRARRGRSRLGTTDQDGHHHQRPDQVELLLDCEGPQVAKRNEGFVGRVPLSDHDLVPVAGRRGCRRRSHPGCDPSAFA